MGIPIQLPSSPPPRPSPGHAPKPSWTSGTFPTPPLTSLSTAAVASSSSSSSSPASSVSTTSLDPVSSSLSLNPGRSPVLTSLQTNPSLPQSSPSPEVPTSTFDENSNNNNSNNNNGAQGGASRTVPRRPVDPVSLPLSASAATDPSEPTPPAPTAPPHERRSPRPHPSLRRVERMPVFIATNTGAASSPTSSTPSTETHPGTRPSNTDTMGSAGINTSPQSSSSPLTARIAGPFLSSAILPSPPPASASSTTTITATSRTTSYPLNLTGSPSTSLLLTSSSSTLSDYSRPVYNLRHINTNHTDYVRQQQLEMEGMLRRQNQHSQIHLGHGSTDHPDMHHYLTDPYTNMEEPVVTRQFPVDESLSRSRLAQRNASSATTSATTLGAAVIGFSTTPYSRSSLQQEHEQVQDQSQGRRGGQGRDQGRDQGERQGQGSPMRWESTDMDRFMRIRARQQEEAQRGRELTMLELEQVRARERVLARTADSGYQRQQWHRRIQAMPEQEWLTEGEREREIERELEREQRRQRRIRHQDNEREQERERERVRREQDLESDREWNRYFPQPVLPMPSNMMPRSEMADADWARSDALPSSRPMTIEVQHPPPAATSTSPVTPTWPSGMMAAPSSLRSHFYPTNSLQYHGGHGEGSGNNGRPFIRADPYVQGLIHIYSGTNQHIMMYGRPVLEPGASYDPYLSEYFENEDAIADGRSPQQGGFSRRNRPGDQGQVQGPMQGQNSANNSSGGEMQGMRIRSGATSRTGNRDNERTATTTTTASSGSRTNESLWVAPSRNDINNASGIGQLGSNSSFSHSSGGSGTRRHPRLMSSPTSRQFPSASFAPPASLDEIMERDRPSRLSQYQSAKEQDRAPQERSQEKITTPSLDLDPTLSSPSGPVGEEETFVQSKDTAETETLTTVLTMQ